jgi:hypothetical protein
MVGAERALLVPSNAYKRAHMEGRRRRGWSDSHFTMRWQVDWELQCPTSSLPIASADVKSWQTQLQPLCTFRRKFASAVPSVGHAQTHSQRSAWMPASDQTPLHRTWYLLDVLIVVALLATTFALQSLDLSYTLAAIPRITHPNVSVAVALLNIVLQLYNTIASVACLLCPSVHADDDSCPAFRHRLSLESQPCPGHCPGLFSGASFHIWRRCFRGYLVARYSL